MSISVVIGGAVVQTILSALIAGVALYRFTRRDRLIVLVGLLFALSFLFNSLQFLALLLRQNTAMNVVGSIYEIIFFVMAGVVYDRATEKEIRRFIIFSTVVFLIGSITNSLFFQREQFASITKLASNIMLLMYCVAYFLRLMRDLPTVHVHRLPMFWINSAFLLYSAGTVFLFAFIQYVIKVHADKVASLWFVNLSLFILQQLIILAAVNYDLKNLNKVRPDLKKSVLKSN